MSKIPIPAQPMRPAQFRRFLIVTCDVSSNPYDDSLADVVVSGQREGRQIRLKKDELNHKPALRAKPVKAHHMLNELAPPRPSQKLFDRK